MSNDTITNINVNLLIPNAYQPRKKINDQTINELALSIKEYGILNPILVRKLNDKYEIIAGERRVIAAKKIGLTEVPAIIKEIDDGKMAELALIENLQRENITPIEEAKAYQNILQLSNLTEEKLSTTVGKSQSFISNKLRLLNLTNEVQEALISRKISERHARSLLTVKDPQKQVELLNRIIQNRLTVKELDNVLKEELEANTSNDSIENKKEEKESDKMNNNFFPNLNTEPNNMSLNTMNMQAMPNNDMTVGVPTPPPVMPEMTQAPAPMTPTGNTFMNDTTPNIPNVAVNMPAQPPVEETVQPVVPNEAVTPNVLADIPLFANQTAEATPVMPTEPVLEPMPEPPIVNVTPPLEVTPSEQITEPLFSQPEPQSIVTPEPTPSVEIPVTVTPDEFTRVQEVLKNNNINFKAYSNETNHCIIIEL